MPSERDLKDENLYWFLQNLVDCSAVLNSVLAFLQRHYQQFLRDSISSSRLSGQSLAVTSGNVLLHCT